MKLANVLEDIRLANVLALLIVLTFIGGMVLIYLAVNA